MRLTSKGQVTIPQALRDLTGIQPGTEVQFSAKDGSVIISKATGGGGRGAELVRRMRGRAEVDLSTDEILALTRER